MAVTGYDAWHIAVLIGGNKFLYKKVERDEELISYLITIEKNFWKENVLKQIPPMFDGSDASVDLLKALYPESTPDSEVQLPGDAGTFIEALDEISVELKSMELQKKEYENQIKDMMKDNEKAYSGERTITWKSYDTNRFDSKRFKFEEPDLYKKYVNTTTARKFVIK